MKIGTVEIETKSYCNLFAVTDEAYDGMAVFVMCGLTGFRPQSYDFIKQHCTYAGKDKGRVRLFKRDDGIFVAYDCNRDNHIYGGRELYELLDDALTMLAEAGATRIILNGIHSHTSPNPRTTDINEEDTLLALIKWIKVHPDAGIKRICCISGGYEFERAILRIAGNAADERI